ncbi:PEP/pyruvate-binding domain-containing protein [Pseudodesulfovibrio senegalensis]|jgi:pyruvate,water dikinase|uniref:Phosphoenolpyruvate synthase n=1 Tax=Pseudodesulfovibrio senegalensis TaxID=1721087 RepID=A0A6N6N271_9BACT|nr:PEP/pyruvate-binding domain-containing protein [Pseudodesulfovibrio senegalensis]KAB1441086.1 phosphoenolpyruvate synthase [Pseudodesulfovibrio senegalensis]
MAKTQKPTPKKKAAPKKKTGAGASAESLQKKLVLNGADIVTIGEEAELLVGGKNYNTAIISQVGNIRAPEFRAISSIAFHILLDETKVHASLIRSIVDKEYNTIDWNSEEINSDPEFLQKFVRTLGRKARAESQEKSGTPIKLRTFINNVVEGFATSPEGIDQLRKRSVLVQTAILSIEVPESVSKAVKSAYRDICKEAGLDDEPVAVRSSAAGEDSRKKAFAGLQDTYLNIVGEDTCLEAYHWDCASAYNLRSMTYRREAILDAIMQAEQTGDDTIAEQAKKEWAIEHTSLSVCIMRMINPVISGTAFSADTATGCRGTDRNDLVSIDASYGLGEAVVGGMVTPDKYYVFQREASKEVVIRYMGCKDKKIVYKEDGSGTHSVPVVENEIYRWALSIAQAEEVAKGVRAISKAYGGMIMDTEFCIDKSSRLWFVQARPETRWNEEFEQHPHTIFMRRLEVEKGAADKAEVILEGNGASRGAGQGTVKFLRSALELNKVNKGDILAAERTDPDMVPGMRIASAIMADVGGDTSHAAITSRELGIPAVIGIQRPEVLRALDNQEVTVDGSRGKVYRGKLPLVEVGGEIDVSTLPDTKTKVGLILADVGQSLFLSRLRNVPDFEVGLLRAEFMLGNIGVHPMALEAYDKDTLDGIVNEKLLEMETRLTKVMKDQLASGLVSLPLKLREYVGQVTGLTRRMDALADQDAARGTDEVLAIQRRIRELDKKLDEKITMATERLDVLKTSVNLEDHVAVIYGYHDLLEGEPSSRSEEWKVWRDHKDDVVRIVRELKDNPQVIGYFNKVRELREEVAHKMGLKSEMDEVRTLPKRIKTLLESRGYRTGKENYIQTLSQGLALFAMAFYGSEIIYRTTDFKSNEYRNLLGGILFEAYEDNPMMGYRGVSRNIHDWELEAFKLARGIYGGKNLCIMFPFVRSMEEARSMKRYLRQVHNLESGKDGLKIILMAEIPSNAILCKEFLKEVDGFSIGSNDMTQMVLATDRDNPSLQHIYDEEDPAVVWAILSAIFAGQRYGKKVGFCGQGVSNSVILRGLVAIAGIVSASVVPDTYHQTKVDMAAVESENIPTSKLGEWLQKQHMDRLKKMLEEKGYGHILKRYKSADDFMEWYEGELDRFSEQLRDHIETPKEDFYRGELEQFRSMFHKPVIYACWDWSHTVEDALHHAGFASFEEQTIALEKQREKKW